MNRLCSSPTIEAQHPAEPLDAIDSYPSSSKVGYSSQDSVRLRKGHYGFNFAIDEHRSFGAHVANVLNEKHWESFGGDVIERRAMAHLLFSW